MNIYTVYDITTGEIVSIISCGQHEIEIQDIGSNLYMEGSGDAALVYVDTINKVFVDKTEYIPTITSTNILADGVSTCTITEIPIGMRILTPYQIFEITDGEFVFTTDEAGEYEFTLISALTLETTVTINAV